MSEMRDEAKRERVPWDVVMLLHRSTSKVSRCGLLVPRARPGVDVLQANSCNDRRGAVDD